MKITLTNEKKQKILKLCTAARLAHTLTINELAKLIRNLVASMEAVCSEINSEKIPFLITQLIFIFH